MARVGAILRLAVRTLGELLVTFSVLLALFIVYQLYYTNVVGRQEMGREVAAMRRQWAAPTAAERASPTPGPGPGIPIASPSPADSTLTSQAAAVSARPSYGDSIAILSIPRLGITDGVPVLEGVGLDVLNKATGHYPGTALPGQVGNFAVAGHRKTHGEPFRHLDELRKGDLVYAQTAHALYTYRLDEDPVIIDPHDLGVVDAVPDQPGATPTEALITLTTCNPWWSSTQRMIVVGRLVDTRAY
jgi:sortase A